MAVGWSQLVMTPSAEAVAELRSSWSWILPEQCTFVLFSIFGDAFFSDADGRVSWLNTGTAQITVVAASEAEFLSALRTQCDEWFLPRLVEQLHAAGSVPGPGECFTYAVLPVFRQGKYEPWNFKPVPAREHFALTAHVHRQIAGLPDGAQVRINVTP
jgi:hypothetical protein